MGLSTQDPDIQKEHTKLYKIRKFRINWVNTEKDTATQSLKKLLKNVWMAILRSWRYCVGARLKF